MSVAATLNATLKIREATAAAALRQLFGIDLKVWKDTRH